MRASAACACFVCWLFLAPGPNAASRPDVVAGREAIAAVAHLEELCARDPAHFDCSVAQRDRACADTRSALDPQGKDAAPAATDLATDITVRLVDYVAGVMIDAACARVGDDEPAADLDALFREVVFDRHEVPVKLAGTVKVDLDTRAGNVRNMNSRLSHLAKVFPSFAGSIEGQMVDIDGEAVDPEPVIRGMCSGLPDLAWSVVDSYADFEQRFEGVPAARYSLNLLGAEAFNALAAGWEVLLPSEPCADYAPVKDSWRVGLRFVAPAERLTLPPDPATRLVGTGASDDADVGGRLDEIRDLVEQVDGSRRPSVCASLGRRLDDEFAPAWDASRKRSREADYHFVNERVYQLELLREAYDAATTLAGPCGADVDPTPWRGAYLRQVVAFVELLEPPLAKTLSLYLGSRFDVDMDRDH